MNKQAHQFGYQDGFTLQDMRGSVYFTPSNGLRDYDTAYANGVADYLDFGDGKRIQRAHLCAKASTIIMEKRYGK